MAVGSSRLLCGAVRVFGCGADTSAADRLRRGPIARLRAHGRDGKLARQKCCLTVRRSRRRIAARLNTGVRRGGDSDETCSENHLSDDLLDVGSSSCRRPGHPTTRSSGQNPCLAQSCRLQSSLQLHLLRTFRCVIIIVRGIDGRPSLRQVFCRSTRAFARAKVLTDR